ncbi:LuxR C-terminal-related transcriptional regulator [Methylobacterium sp. CB376]|uniref:LuxR C-terminal-related transcriptional regulator n=1 Tax=unclassified Methylobacterium TaxID=2615210 RepID=UPI0002F865D7|nr:MULTISPECIES: LuxR C-terminal-related transcriptional regulator [Methylobacterium]WFT82976.1 LuxR C-terminal-related transcriptional regulator [Methylobacterium nodulans]
MPVAAEAMRLGARDFIEKPFDDEIPLRAVRAALTSGSPPPTADPTLRAFARPVEGLSGRERQVLTPLVAGSTAKEIGRALAIRPRAAAAYQAESMEKRQAGRLSELVRRAVLSGLERALRDINLESGLGR